MRDVILVTCGTSLINNIKKENVSPETAPNWLKNLSPKDRLCGAEINSIAMMAEEYGEEVSPGTVCLYCSETKDGHLAAEILQEALPSLFPGITVKAKIIDGLDPGRCDAFRRRGLKGLLAALAEDTRKYGPHRTVINATGGLKVMVALAQSLAQAMGIPAYYKFDRAEEGLMIPSMPLEFDMGLWLRLEEWLRTLDEENVLKEGQLRAISSNLAPEDREKIQVMLEETYVTEGKGHAAERFRVYSLSPLGTLFLEAGRSLFWQRKKQLLPSEVTPTEKGAEVQHSVKEGHSRIFENNYGIGDRLLALPFVSRVRVHWFNDKGGTISRCHIQDREQKVMEVDWGNGKGHIKYKLDLPTAANETQLQAAAAAVNEMLQEWR